MPSAFSEVVIEGPFMLVKGFLMGYLAGSGKSFEYFFHRKAGIRQETLKDMLKGLFDFENYVHLCIESRVVGNFTAAVEQAHDKIGLSVKSVQNVHSATFTFSFEVFNEELAEELKGIFAAVGPGLELTNFKPMEQHADDAYGLEGYAPVHSYLYRGSGSVAGDFMDIMSLYLAIKRSKAEELVITSDIGLKFEERISNLLD
jgi:hypothetical protein